ncbi:hypothetical protein [Rhodanobacter sp. Root179]|uniref:hypothetical protein n=1 Tax=Rhodanobacter sp. Root179 TaxID=1736482 RepID=UPI001F27A8E4|nr:hypothetical protein [Rhodanobacter sp. Root179]
METFSVVGYTVSVPFDEPWADSFPCACDPLIVDVDAHVILAHINCRVTVVMIQGVERCDDGSVDDGSISPDWPAHLPLQCAYREAGHTVVTKETH